MDLTNNFDPIVAKQVKYIYDAFCKEYANARYDERKEIVGIGEPGKYLFCYFKSVGDKIFVKFKSEEQSFELPTSLEKLNYCIRKTVLFFNNNDFLTAKKRTYKRREDIASRCEINLSICADVDRLIEQYSATETFFEQKIIEFRQLLGVFIEQVINSDRDKAIITSLLEQKDKRATLQELGEKYGITRETVRQFSIHV